MSGFIHISRDELEVIAPRLPRGVSYDPTEGVLRVDAETEKTVSDLLADLPALREEAFAALKARLKGAIDAAAEIERLKYITPGAGQSMTYAQKAEEARLCLAAAGPDPDDYPLLAAEIGITASTLVGVAQVVATANAQWLQIGAAIEAARLSAKKSVAETETIEEAQLAASAIVWPNG